MNEKNEFFPEDLTKEKSLWDIYKASRPIPNTKFNRLITISATLLVAAEIFFSKRLTSQYVLEVQQLSSLGIQIGLSTLGFLIAGFTIFTTISKPRLSISMSQMRHPGLDISYLKKNYFVFMRVFIYYITFCFFCFAMIIAAKPDGLAETIINLSPSAELLKATFSRAAYATTIIFYTIILVQLKSFVFNTYHSVMTALRWEAIDPD